jgi:hypothetical protein
MKNQEPKIRSTSADEADQLRQAQRTLFSGLSTSEQDDVLLIPSIPCACWKVGEELWTAGVRQFPDLPLFRISVNCLPPHWLTGQPEFWSKFGRLSEITFASEGVESRPCQMRRASSESGFAACARPKPSSKRSFLPRQFLYSSGIGCLRVASSTSAPWERTGVITTVSGLGARLMCPCPRWKRSDSDGYPSGQLANAQMDGE